MRSRSMSLRVGLPPLVRGAPTHDVGRAVADGPTPAGAGSTTWAMPRSNACGAYPRWCGEHPATARRLLRRGGLPPLVRGARQRANCAAAGVGPTPAGAGSTINPLAAQAMTSAYPRWCGEHGDSDAHDRRVGGLPPLVRGARPSSAPTAATPGPTPAGAGSTTSRNAIRTVLPAYPRWCGEHPA